MVVYRNRSRPKLLELESQLGCSFTLNPDQKYETAATSVALAFAQGPDEETSTSGLVKFLLANQVHIMIFQGILDLACNTAGNLR